MIVMLLKPTSPMRYSVLQVPSSRVIPPKHRRLVPQQFLNQIRRYILVGFVMGQFPWWYLWSHSWGFTANCIAFNTEDPLCFSRFTALHRMWLHIYTTLCDNTPTMWGAPILVILLIFCFVVLAAGCVANSIFDPELELEKPKFY